MSKRNGKANSDQTQTPDQRLEEMRKLMSAPITERERKYWARLQKEAEEEQKRFEERMPHLMKRHRQRLIKAGLLEPRQPHSKSDGNSA